MLYLGDAHCWSSAVGSNQVIRVVQRPPMPGCDNLYPGLSGQLQDFLVSLLRISVGISFEDQVGDLPRFEQLWQNRLGRLSDDEELRLLIDLRYGQGKV